MSGMPAERGIAILRQIDPTATLVAVGDLWLVRHRIAMAGELPSPLGRDPDKLLQRVVFVLSMARSLQAGGHTWRWRMGWHHPGDQHWEQVARP